MNAILVIVPTIKRLFKLKMALITILVKDGDKIMEEYLAKNRRPYKILMWFPINIDRISGSGDTTRHRLRRNIGRHDGTGGKLS